MAGVMWGSSMAGRQYEKKRKSSLRMQIFHYRLPLYIRVNKIIIIGSDNGLSPGRRQAIIWTNAGILLIWPLGTNFNEILIEIDIFSFKKMHLKILSGKWRPFCLVLNVIPADRTAWVGTEKTKVVIMTTLSSLMAPQVIVMTTCGATSDDKDSIMITLVLQYMAALCHAWYWECQLCTAFFV